MKRVVLVLVLALTVALLGACSDTTDSSAAGGLGGAPSPPGASSPVPGGSTTPSASAASSSNGSRSGSQTVEVFFNRPEGGVSGCTSVEPVERRVEKTEAVATAALNELFAGPSNAEQARGLMSFFSADTAGLLRSVRVEQQTAYLDLDAAFLEINNVSTTCGGSMTLASIEATLKQFTTVEEIRYAIEAEPATFYDFMQIGCPRPRPRSAGDRCDPAPFQRR
jgi:spore germination protein GerM